RGEELYVVAGLAGGGALVFQPHLHALAARGGEFPMLLGERRLAVAAGGGARHAVRVGVHVDAMWAGRVLGVGRQAVDQHLSVIAAARLLDRDREINELVRSRRRRAAVRLGDV